MMEKPELMVGDGLPAATSEGKILQQHVEIESTKLAIERLLVIEQPAATSEGVVLQQRVEIESTKRAIERLLASYDDIVMEHAETHREPGAPATPVGSRKIPRSPRSPRSPSRQTSGMAVRRRKQLRRMELERHGRRDA